jgi:hypothetical protein
MYLFVRGSISNETMKSDAAARVLSNAKAGAPGTFSNSLEHLHILSLVHSAV